MLSWPRAAHHAQEGTSALPRVVALESVERRRPFQGGSRVFCATCPGRGAWIPSSRSHIVGKDPGSLSPERHPCEAFCSGRVEVFHLGALVSVLRAWGLGGWAAGLLLGPPYPVKSEDLTFTPPPGLEQIGDREAGQDRQTAPLQPKCGAGGMGERNGRPPARSPSPCDPERYPSLRRLCGWQGGEPGSTTLLGPCVPLSRAGGIGQHPGTPTPQEAGTRGPASRETAVPRDSSPPFSEGLLPVPAGLWPGNEACKGG